MTTSQRQLPSQLCNWRRRSLRAQSELGMQIYLGQYVPDVRPHSHKPPAPACGRPGGMIQNNDELSKTTRMWCVPDPAHVAASGIRKSFRTTCRSLSGLIRPASATPGCGCSLYKTPTANIICQKRPPSSKSGNVCPQHPSREGSHVVNGYRSKPQTLSQKGTAGP